MESAQKMDVVDISMSVVDINDKLEDEPSSCGCDRKCTIEVSYMASKLRTHSPKIVARIWLAQRKRLQFSKTEVLLWAQTTNLKPEIEDIIKAMHDFARCPKIMEFAGKFEDWKEAVAKIREDLQKKQEKSMKTDVDENIKVTVDFDGQRLDFELKQSNTVKTLKSKIQHRIGVKAEYQVLRSVESFLEAMEDSQTLVHYYGMKRHATIELDFKFPTFFPDNI